jgi:hypothetical protein
VTSELFYRRFLGVRSKILPYEKVHHYSPRIGQEVAREGGTRSVGRSAMAQWRISKPERPARTCQGDPQYSHNFLSPNGGKLVDVGRKIEVTYCSKDLTDKTEAKTSNLRGSWRAFTIRLLYRGHLRRFVVNCSGSSSSRPASSSESE